MKRVLILCTGNSCRSQMAEYLWNDLARGEWQAVSAGSKPAGYVHPLAIKVMQELGHDLSTAESEHLDRYANEPFDLVVTVCDNARESCPVMPHVGQSFHWPFIDPAHATGNDDERLLVFRDVRDQIRDRIADYLRSGE